MKVVIPSTGYRGKNMVFSTPHDEFCISGHDIWGEGTWDRYLQAPKMYLVISHTRGEHGRVDQSGPEGQNSRFQAILTSKIA